MKSALRPALVLLLAFTVVCGVLYPALVTGIAQLAMPGKANGSLVHDANGKVVGSALIGQPFDDDRFFWGRPSALGPFPYNAANSSGSNLGPTNPALRDAVAERLKHLRDKHPGAGEVPIDLVTASSSGLDPHISPAAAYYQVARVAAARGLGVDALRALVEAHVEPRTLGFLGEPVVNVLALNLALERR